MSTRRHAARVILLDESGRVLLFRGGDPHRPEAGTWWFTPGGGLDDGETVEQAARREVREETGLVITDLGPVVLERSVEFEVDNREWTDLERRLMLEHRWWTRDELAITSETVYPEGLAELL